MRLSRRRWCKFLGKRQRNHLKNDAGQGRKSLSIIQLAEINDPDTERYDMIWDLQGVRGNLTLYSEEHFRNQNEEPLYLRAIQGHLALFLTQERLPTNCTKELHHVGYSNVEDVNSEDFNYHKG